MMLRKFITSFRRNQTIKRNGTTINRRLFEICKKIVQLERIKRIMTNRIQMKTLIKLGKYNDRRGHITKNLLKRVGNKRGHKVVLFC